MITFDNLLHPIRAAFLSNGRSIDRQEWQAKRDARPQTRVFETHNVQVQFYIAPTVEALKEQIKPNLPWAEDHFQERVSGQPLNPGEQYKNWPWYEQGVEEHKPQGKFSHTYMERFWAKKANPDHIYLRDGYRTGIRYEYGDLTGLVELLQERPYTRQAYLPIWFPEDITAAWLGERVPCTLGYHFQATPSLNHESPPVLDMFYPMRSCDYFRYLRDDAYMAARLLQWVAGKVQMQVGQLTMHIANLHIFADEYSRLHNEHQQESARRMNIAF